MEIGHSLFESQDKCEEQH